MSNTSRTGELILYHMRQLRSQGRVATRQVLSELLNVKLAIVDDHIKRMKDDGKVRSPVNGVFEVVEPAPPPRAPSVTFLPDGVVKVELGDQILEMQSLAEVELVSMALAGVFSRYGYARARD